MRLNITTLLDGPTRSNWKYFIFIFVLSTASLPLLYDGGYDDKISLTIAIIWSYAIWVTQFTGHYLIISRLDKYVPWVKRPLLRMVLGIVFMVIYASLAFMAVNTAMNLIFFQRWPTGSLMFWIKNSWYAIKISFWASLAVTVIGFFRAWKSAEVEKEKLNTQMMTHKYNALREQINPHFLFNSLNVLSDLVYEDQDLAVKFIRQMSDLYRYVLSVKNEDLVSLDRELEFVKSFAFLLQTRFEKGLNIEFDLIPNSDEQVVPMSLQLLIENAVKHNEVSTDHPLNVKVFREADKVVVKNELRLKKNVEPTTKKGLENLKNRYDFLSDVAMEVDQDDKSFTVKVPLLRLDK